MANCNYCKRPLKTAPEGFLWYFCNFHCEAMYTATDGNEVAQGTQYVSAKWPPK